MASRARVVALREAVEQLRGSAVNQVEGAEIALVTARKARLQKLVEEGDKAAVAAVKLGEDPTRFLSTIQIGITSIGVLNGIVGEAALAGSFG